jgi:hypothetical protein
VHHSTTVSQDNLLSSDLLHTTLEDIPALSLQKMARSRDPDAGLLLAERRARQKVRRAKKIKSQKLASEMAKQQRLEALKHDVSLRRERAAGVAKKHGNRKKYALNTKKKKRGGSNDKPPQEFNQNQIETARRRTLKRLREKKLNLRRQEQARRQHDRDKANEKWRVRDAKLAIDRQRRVQRQRFVDTKRKAFAVKVSNRQQQQQQQYQTTMFQTKNKKKPLASILKAPNANGRKKHPTVAQPQQPVHSRSLDNNGKERDQDADEEHGFEDDIADVSAVYEDVEAWVKSVYGGGDDENALSVHSVSGRTAIPSKEIYHENNERQQQAEDDEAFLDAILGE